MRKVLFLITLWFFLGVKAQVTVNKEANRPRVGDKFVRQQVTICPVGNSGVDAVWDMSNCEVLTGDHIIEYSGDSLQHFIMSEDLEMQHIRLSGDSLLLDRRENRLSNIRYSKATLLIKYPLYYGDSITSTFEGDGTYCGDHHVWVSGDQTLHADGTGVLILSESDTLRNVLRVKSVTNQMMVMSMDTIDIDPNQWKHERIIRYDWYVSGYRYPLFTSITRNTLAGDSVIATRQSAYRQLPFDAESIVDPQNELLRKTIAEQPAKSVSSDKCPIDYELTVNQGILNIHYSSESACQGTFMVTSVSGVVYKKSSFTCPSQEVTDMRIDCSGLLRGEYLFSVIVNGKVYTKNITI